MAPRPHDGPVPCGVVAAALGTGGSDSVASGCHYRLVAWDWLASVSTGVVGVAGIAGTLWAANIGRKTQLESARHQATAEDRRIERADKRALYAKLLHHAETTENNARVVWTLERQFGDDEPTPEQLEISGLLEGWTELGSILTQHSKTLKEQITQLRQLVAETLVVGSQEVGSAAASLPTKLATVYEEGEVYAWAMAYSDLMDAMRRDLGLPDLARSAEGIASLEALRQPPPDTEPAQSSG